LFDEPHGTHDLDLAENTSFQLLGHKILFCFFGFENRRIPGWLRVSCNERGFSYLSGEYSGIVVIINSFAVSCFCSLNYYFVEPFVLKWYFWCVKPGLSTCAHFPGSSVDLINRIKWVPDRLDRTTVITVSALCWEHVTWADPH
jgi:hypothetical protein